MEIRRFLRRLAPAVALAAATIGFAVFGFSDATPVVPTEPKHGLAPALRPGAQLCEAAAAAALPATVREPASSPILDAFDEQHRDAVSQVLAEKRVVVVQCIVLEASRPEKTGGGVRELVRYEPFTDRREVLVPAARLDGDALGGRIEIEDYAFSPDQKQVLVFTKSERVWGQIGMSKLR